MHAGSVSISYLHQSETVLKNLHISTISLLFTGQKRHSNGSRKDNRGNRRLMIFNNYNRSIPLFLIIMTMYIFVNAKVRIFQSAHLKIHFS